MTNQDKWTIVQHSGYGYGENPQFALAVEIRKVSNLTDLKAVESVNGAVFDSYGAAEDFAFEANYPPDVVGIIPCVKGEFSKKKVDGLRIYIPVRGAPVG